MLINVTRFNKTFLIDDGLAGNLDYCLKNTQNNNDNVIMIDGREGSGKSTGLAFPCAWYLSGEKIRVVFTGEQFKEAYSIAEKGSTIVFDEFVTVGMSVQAMNKVQQEIIQFMTMSRKRLVNVILVVPNYFMFGWYFTTHRSIMLLHTYQKDLLSRGDFAFYSGSRMGQMRLKLSKIRIHNLKYANFMGKFPKYPDNMFISEEEYQKAKDEAIASLGKDTEEKPKASQGYLKKEDVALKLMELGYDDSFIMSFVNWEYQTIMNFKTKIKKTNKEIWDNITTTREKNSLKI